MKVVDPQHRSVSLPSDAFDEVVDFAVAIGAHDVAHEARAAREQLWCSQMFVMVLGAPAARHAFVRKLLSAEALPKHLGDEESAPILIRHGRVPHVRVHRAGSTHDEPLDHAANLGAGFDALELAVPSSALEQGLCIVHPFRRSSAVRGLIPRLDLAMIVTSDATSIVQELERARGFGFDPGNIVLVAPAAHSSASVSSMYTEFADTSLGWSRLRAFIRRRAEQSGMTAGERYRVHEVRRVLARLEHILAERQLALEFPSTEARVQNRRRAAAVVRAVLENRRHEPSSLVNADLAHRLETERTKFLMAIKADLLGELAELIARSNEPPALVLPRAIALAQELSASAVFMWSEHVADISHDSLAAIFEHHIQQLWRELDIATETALAAAALLVEPRSFVRRPRVGRVPTPPSRGQVGDWLRSRSGLQRRAMSVAAELLVTSLETGSRSLVEHCLESIVESRRAFEAAFANTLEWMAETCADGSRYASEHRRDGGPALEDAVRQNQMHQRRLDELVEVLAP